MKPKTQNIELDKKGVFDCKDENELEELSQYTRHKVCTLLRYKEILTLIKQRVKVAIALDKLRFDRKLFYDIVKSTPGLKSELRNCRASAAHDLAQLVIEKDKTGNATLQMLKATYASYYNKHSEEEDEIELSEKTRSILLDRELDVSVRVNAILSDYYNNNLPIHQAERLIALELKGAPAEIRSQIEGSITLAEGVKLPTK